MFWGRNSTVGLATGYGLDGPWFEARRGHEIFSSYPSTPAIKPICLFYSGTGALSQGYSD